MIIITEWILLQGFFKNQFAGLNEWGGAEKEKYKMLNNSKIYDPPMNTHTHTILMSRTLIWKKKKIKKNNREKGVRNRKKTN